MRLPGQASVGGRLWSGHASMGRQGNAGDNRKGLGMEYPKTTKNVGQPCAICGQSANAQATVEALQRERDEEQQRLRVVCQQRNDAQAALDAEREKRTALLAEIDEGLTLSDNLLAIKTVMELYDKLAQLQALVRPFAELAKHLDGREFNTLHAVLRNGTWIKVTMDDFMALKAATLDATTPATKGGNGE